MVIKELYVFEPIYSSSQTQEVNIVVISFLWLKTLRWNKSGDEVSVKQLRMQWIQDSKSCSLLLELINFTIMLQKTQLERKNRFLIKSFDPFTQLFLFPFIKSQYKSGVVVLHL
jgi:hypothetical protein